MTKIKIIKILLIFLAIFFISAVGYGAWRVNRDIDRASQGISSLIVDSVSEDTSHLPDQETLSNSDAGDKDIDTSDWKTYRNEEYGFEVKYPKGWYWEAYTDEFATHTLLAIGFYPVGKERGYEYRGDIELSYREKKPFDSFDQYIKEIPLLEENMTTVETNNGRKVVFGYDLPGNVMHDLALVDCSDAIVAINSVNATNRTELIQIAKSIECSK